MKGFKVIQDPETGRNDIAFDDDGNISIVDGNELTAQTIQTIIGTNKGEWVLNSDEGINFNAVMGKNITDDMVRSQCQAGVAQVDDEMFINNFRMDVDNRHSTVTFDLEKDNTDIATVSTVWN